MKLGPSALLLGRRSYRCAGCDVADTAGRHGDPAALHEVRTLINRLRTLTPVSGWPAGGFGYSPVRVSRAAMLARESSRAFSRAATTQRSSRHTTTKSCMEKRVDG